LAKSSKDILCFGEISWDRLWLLNRIPRGSGDCHLLFEQEMPGGCALNTACVLRALGASVTLGGNAVGDDERGRGIADHLKSAGVDSRLVLRAGVRTPFCQCLVSQDDGHRDFVLEHSDIQAFGGPELGTLVEECRRGHYAQAFVQPYVREASRRLLESVQEVEGLWLLIQDQEPDSEFVPLVDAIQISLPEGEEFTVTAIGSLTAPYFRGRMTRVFVTNGPHGVAHCERGEAPVLVPGVRAPEVRDTTGCGDAFRAGLMAGRLRGLSWADSIRLGTRVGALKAGILGSHFHALPQGVTL
jgi:sugar/nucleoside kinase (ribokinase family)